MHIFFRVDSSYRIGTGHVMRCVALADALRAQGNKITFICRKLTGNLISFLKDKDFSVIELDYDPANEVKLASLTEHQQWLGVSQEKDLADTLACLARQQVIDWLIVDSYALDKNWEKPCRQYAKHIMVIDDLADRFHDADILLDQNYYENPQSRYLKFVPQTCNVLIGPQFALLRPEFESLRSKMRNNISQIERVMVSLGGIDQYNMTRIVLDGIRQSSLNDVVVDVIMGVASPHRNEIQQFCDTHKNYFFHSPALNMAELMLNADLAIGAGGATTWERCCLGLPSLVVCIANNQKQLISEAIKANFLGYVGEASAIKASHISQILNELRDNSQQLLEWRQNGLNMVDGRGVKRAIEAMQTFKS
jgi:UDP-2,4-diacetamido-2,4,6-trideoxy-beta-L-altropyranose hydrolase